MQGSAQHLLMHGNPRQMRPIDLWNEVQC
jgi:hypothetical protein